jgi:hypothetical protein
MIKQIENVTKIVITQDMLDVANKYALDHIKADAHETPIFQTNEYKNKLVGYLGQVAFKKFLFDNGVKTNFSKINMDGSPDFYDFKINGETIDVKTLLWNSYWEYEHHKNWLPETGSIKDIHDLLKNFFFLIPQVQLNIDDFYNPYWNTRKKKNPPKDIYWALFLKQGENNFLNSIVYIVGWCKHEKILEANSEKSFFRFNNKYHTNIAIPLCELTSNETFFND